jgi:hypothetical protein
MARKKTPAGKATWIGMEPVKDPETGEISPRWGALIDALARFAAKRDRELAQAIRLERPDWNEWVRGVRTDLRISGG